MQILRYILLPISWLYALTVRMRNAAYDLNWFKSERGAVKNLIIGNITVGGTGKTPHTIFLAQHLQEQFKIAILSRGYGRKSKGYLELDQSTHWSTSGDEPLLYTFRTNASVAVCEDRLEGLKKLKTSAAPDLVILDDALQHRRLKGDVNIALVRADKLPENDFYLPTGTLRDSRTRLKQVDAVIITHADRLIARKESLPTSLGLKSETPIFYSNIRYGTPYMLNDSTVEVDIAESIFLVTGIAHPKPLVEHLERLGSKVLHRAYRDHAPFSENDVEQWKATMLDAGIKMLVTTEKDAMRMKGLPHIEAVQIVVVPIEIQIQDHEILLRLISEKLNE